MNEARPKRERSSRNFVAASLLVTTVGTEEEGGPRRDIGALE